MTFLKSARCRDSDLSRLKSFAYHNLCEFIHVLDAINRCLYKRRGICQTNRMPKIAPAPPTLPNPATEEGVAEELLETAFRLPLEDDEELDTDDLIDAAEELLRQGAPHDFDVAIIGAGPGGLACATHLAQSNTDGEMKVVVIEAREVGGVCLNRGCIPTKTLLESVGALRLVRRAGAFGVGIGGEVTVDFAKMQARKREVVESLRRAALEQLEDAGVPILRGVARFVDEHTLEISGPDARELTAVHVVVATGGVPLKLPIDGADLPGVLTSDEALELRSVPASMMVIGGGAVGVEFASIFAEVGARVCIIEKDEQLLPGEDEDIQSAMRKSVEESGIEVVCGADISSISEGGDGLVAHFERGGQTETRTAALVLMAAGRKPNLDELGLEAADVELESGHIKVDESYETSTGGVWAIGDCIRRVGWAHQAAMEGRRVADCILGAPCDADPRFIPSCYYTFPEVATVGLTLEAARDLGVTARVGKFPFRANGRANTSGDAGGFVKLVVEADGDKILGAQIIGPRATELINEIALAMRQGDGAATLADSLHAHPTFAETLPGAARAALEG